MVFINTGGFARLVSVLNWFVNLIGNIYNILILYIRNKCKRLFIGFV